jgi:hypothetical protein
VRKEYGRRTETDNGTKGIKENTKEGEGSEDGQIKGVRNNTEERKEGHKSTSVYEELLNSEWYYTQE